MWGHVDIDVGGVVIRGKGLGWRNSVIGFEEFGRVG